MSKLKSFTLIELLLVILLVGLILSLSLNIFKTSKNITIQQLYSKLYPNGEIIITPHQNKYNIKITNPKVYQYYNNKLIEKKFLNQILFKYQVKDGIGESFILECEEGVFLFKPFWILKFNSIEDALKYQSKLIK